MTPKSDSPPTIGRRLLDARKARGITQELAAEHLGLSRPTFIAIEKGTRAAKETEVAKLAALYGQPVHQLVCANPPLTEFLPHFRAALEKVAPAQVEPLQAAIADFKEFIENYIDLERRMKAPLRRSDPPPVALNQRVDVVELAEDVASRERQRLGLGDHPIPNIRSMLEAEVGVRIFFGRLPPSFAGMYIYVDQLGGCIYINWGHPPEKQRASIAHEYGHLIVDRHAAGVDYVSLRGRKPANERFAESFAMSFLMPASSVRVRFNEVVSSTGNFQVADLVRMKHFFGTSMEAMALRLEALGLLRTGSWELLKEKGLPVREAERRLGLAAETQREPACPQLYRLLAVHAYERGELSEKELANYLRCDVWEARRIVRESTTSVELDAEGQAQPMQANLDASLLIDQT